MGYEPEGLNYYKIEGKLYLTNETEAAVLHFPDGIQTEPVTLEGEEYAYRYDEIVIDEFRNHDMIEESENYLVFNFNEVNL